MERKIKTIYDAKICERKKAKTTKNNHSVYFLRSRAEVVSLLSSLLIYFCICISKIYTYRSGKNMQDPDVHMQVNVKTIEQSLDIVRSLTKVCKILFSHISI